MNGTEASAAQKWGRWALRRARAVRGWPLLVLAALAVALVQRGSLIVSTRPFPPDSTPEGSYARIALAIAERRPRDAFAYLETEAQWAAYSIRDARAKAVLCVRTTYPPDQRERTIAGWRDEAAAPDGADVFALLAARKGWIARLERDLSGKARVDVQGERATVITARGTRYAFRKRDNGIWGLTLFTAELQAEAERAARDLRVVQGGDRDAGSDSNGADDRP